MKVGSERFYKESKYNGDKSRRFWDAIHAHPNHNDLYDIACALQQAEALVSRLEKLVLYQLHDNPKTARMLS